MGEGNKEALVERINSQRSKLNSSGKALQSELSLAYQLKQSVHKHPKRWVIGGLVSAYVLSSLLRRKKIIYKDRSRKGGLLRRVFRTAFFFARPTLTAVAVKKARDYAEDRLGPLPDNSMLGDPPQK